MRFASAVAALGLVAALCGACGSNVVVATTTSTGTSSGPAGAGGSGGATGSGTGPGATGSGGGATGSGGGATGAGGGAASYSAFALVTNLPRYVIFKREPAPDRCVRLTVAMTGGAGPGIQTPMGWSVGQAEVTAHASDCALAGGYPVVTQASVAASAESGTLTQTPAAFPCSVSIHATLTFPAGPAWAPPSDALDADGLQIQGAGCGG